MIVPYACQPLTELHNFENKQDTVLLTLDTNEEKGIHPAEIRQLKNVLLFSNPESYRLERSENRIEMVILSVSFFI